MSSVIDQVLIPFIRHIYHYLNLSFFIIRAQNDAYVYITYKISYLAMARWCPEKISTIGVVMCYFGLCCPVRHYHQSHMGPFHNCRYVDSVTGVQLNVEWLIVKFITDSLVYWMLLMSIQSDIMMFLTWASWRPILPVNERTACAICCPDQKQRKCGSFALFLFVDHWIPITKSQSMG